MLTVDSSVGRLLLLVVELCAAAEVRALTLCSDAAAVTRVFLRRFFCLSRVDG